MKIYFDDRDYDGQFLRTVDYAPAGAQVGEAWAIAAQIGAGDKTSWYDAWSSFADRLYELAIKSRDTGHRVSARNAFYQRGDLQLAAGSQERKESFAVDATVSTRLRLASVFATCLR